MWKTKGYLRNPFSLHAQFLFSFIVAHDTKLLSFLTWPGDFVPVLMLLFYLRVSHIHIYMYTHTHGASLLAQVVKNLPAMQSLIPGLGDPLEEGIASYSNILD